MRTASRRPFRCSPPPEFCALRRRFQFSGTETFILSHTHFLYLPPLSMSFLLRPKLAAILLCPDAFPPLFSILRRAYASSLVFFPFPCSRLHWSYLDQFFRNASSCLSPLSIPSPNRNHLQFFNFSRSTPPLGSSSRGDQLLPYSFLRNPRPLRWRRQLRPPG